MKPKTPVLSISAPFTTWRRSTRIAVLGALALLAVPAAALADPWIPAAGDGVIKPMFRLTQADSAFSDTSFGTATQPSSSSHTLDQLRVTGVQGLGHGFSLDYDLRAGWASSTKIKNGQPVTETSSGLQDQQVGFSYGLRQTRTFADAVGLSVIAPTGSTGPGPRLGAGHWAFQPEYQLGLSRGKFGMTLKLAPRIFADSGVTQLRSTLELAVRPDPRFALIGSAFLVRTVNKGQGLAPADLEEGYDLLRLGVGAEYKLTRQLRPFVAYEQDVAGMARHAGHRFIFGIAVHY